MTNQEPEHPLAADETKTICEATLKTPRIAVVWEPVVNEEAKEKLLQALEMMFANQETSLNVSQLDDIGSADG